MTNRPSPEVREAHGAERLEVTIVVGRLAWATFVDSIRTGQDF
ncbi:hypothetical protein NKG94_34340 [Micromonospora sp. M12]